MYRFSERPIDVTKSTDIKANFCYNGIGADNVSSGHNRQDLQILNIIALITANSKHGR